MVNGTQRSLTVFTRTYYLLDNFSEVCSKCSVLPDVGTRGYNLVCLLGSMSPANGNQSESKVVLVHTVKAYGEVEV
jgi:hypothetical protein